MNNLKTFEEYRLNEQFYDDVNNLDFTPLYVLGGIVLTLLLFAFGADGTILNGIKKYFFKLKSVKYYTEEINDLVVELSEEQKIKLKKFIRKSIFIKWTNFNYDNYYSTKKRKKFDEDMNKLLKIFNYEQQMKLIELITKLENELERQWCRNWGYDGLNDPDFRPLKNMK